MNSVSRFWRLPRYEKKLFWEALSLLLLSQLAVRTIAFRHIYSYLGDRWRHSSGNLDLTDDIRLVKLALSRAARCLPWESLCLSRSIAAFIMLRRRGIPAVMFAGVKLKESSLIAHAWVRAGHELTDLSPDDAVFTTVLTIGQEPLDQ